MSNLLILGASNVTLALPLICSIVSQDIANSPSSSGFNLLVAAGHGRSYCGTSRVLARTLPSIAECKIWETTDCLHCKNRETSAIITDIGNDLLYGFSPEEIVDSVKNCTERLLKYCKNFEIILSLLPKERLEKMSSIQYHIARSLLFPCKKHESLSSIMKKVSLLQEGLKVLGESFNLRTITPPPTWYGIDPIHIKRKERLQAWASIFYLLHQSQSIDWLVRPTLRESMRAYLQKPERRKLLGIELYKEQPCLTLGDDRYLYLY